MGSEFDMVSHYHDQHNPYMEALNMAASYPPIEHRYPTMWEEFQVPLWGIGFGLMLLVQAVKLVWFTI